MRRIALLTGLMCGVILAQCQSESSENFLLTDPDYVKETYRYCSADTQCVTAMSACGGPVSVNKRKRKAFIDMDRKRTANLKCMMFPEVDYTKITHHCVQNYCELRGLDEQLVGTLFERKSGD